MNIKPILFSTPMVQAILEERKTQTRRIIKNQPDARGLRTSNVEYEDWHGREVKPKYKSGDILWVRETWSLFGWDYMEGFVNIQYKDETVKHFYPAFDGFDEWIGRKIEKLEDKGILEADPDDESEERWILNGKLWEPSIFMPKWACRIFLEVTNVRVERLQDISDKDMVSEGLKVDEERNFYDYSENKFMWKHPALSFFSLWESINGHKSWDVNPWVWVYDFKRVEKPTNF